MNTQTKPIEPTPGLKAHPEQGKGNVYEQITERIIAMLEQGTIPWRKPWKALSGMPRNLVTRKAYRGINVFLLHAMHYESPFWLTYRQAQELGGQVRKGEKACPVVFWKQIEVEDKQTGEKEKFPMMRFYYVFNLAQIDGIKGTPAPMPEVSTSEPAQPDQILAAMPSRPEIKFGMRMAFYAPSEDFIGMPDRARFESDAKFYSTLYHEAVHSSGHPARLNRSTLTEAEGFGSNPYCKEELIAEMGAAFLCGQAGIEESTLENSAAYLKGWLEQLQNDKKLIVQAAAQAQKAADYILGVKHEEAATVAKEAGIS